MGFKENTYIYEVEKFNEKESFELLSWNAFKGRQVDLSYMEVLSYVIQYTKGLPLALEVIGSHLFGKCIDEWKSAIDIYKKIPNEDVQQILKVSYDGLKEVEKEIFLDIACFYKRKELKYVKDLEEYAHGFDPSYGIGVLIDKCLISIDHDKRIEMHDLIQDMGREIIRQESPKESGERSRLWYHEDVIDVLENDTVSKTCMKFSFVHQYYLNNFFLVILIILFIIIFVFYMICEFRKFFFLLYKK